MKEGHGHLAWLYGTAVATIGMFVSRVFILSMSKFSPISDNAGGIIEISLQDHSVRVITDKLDAAGNVTKANTKGYSIGNASLDCFLLFSVYMDEVSLLIKQNLRLLIYLKLKFLKLVYFDQQRVFLFSSLLMSAGATAYQALIKEVRNQIKED